MSVLTDIQSRLVADAGVSAITTNISLSVSNEGDTLPRVTIHTVSAAHKHHTTAATGKVVGRVQIDCHAGSPVGSEALAEAVRQSLDGYRGTVGATFVSMCHLDDERSQVTAPTEGRNESGGIFTVQQDYSVGWSVTVPTF
jgi:hypothetical protein